MLVHQRVDFRIHSMKVTLENGCALSTRKKLGVTRRFAK
jgi:hypothetical protein